MNKILVVDSSVQNTDLLSRLLSAYGYETMSSESGHNALAKAAAFKPDIVILDINLSDMSGYDVCKRIKNSPQTKYIMVLCTSSIVTRETTTHAIQVGADDFIEKTFDPSLLLIKVKSLLRVKKLSDQLKSNFAELEEKNNLLDMQMKMARQVQRSLISDIFFTFNNVRVSGRYMPALDIGGDFYNVMELQDDCVGVVLGDVSGHGISAALLTAMMHSMTRGLMQRNLPPEQFLQAVNIEYCKNFVSTSIEMYVCMFYLVIDTKAHKLYYSNAGQALPILVDSQGHRAIELDSGGIPIGFMPDSSYECKVMPYNKHDMLLLHTDGLADVFYKDNPDGFLQQMKNTLLDVYTIEDEKEITDIILSEFYAMTTTGTQKFELDDVSIVLCKL